MAYVKGGVWTNVEDEILRAAISKYGLNQWARVSSLLARKTAKQCKARWTEWLDPTIKKIEWSREEDEKLLHLAKIFPAQWRTIAPFVGRTAHQCIQRYERLLAEVAGEVEGEDASAVASAPATEGDQFPETKPARPDAVDMDEDEKEMLSEARARLANTQGKKAKRKDRERMLEDSRRLSQLQKRRELKNAGIDTRLSKRKKNEMDYNADIPFEHKPARGFYSTAEEEHENDSERLQHKQMHRTAADAPGPSQKRDKATLSKEDEEKKKEQQKTASAQRTLQLAQLDLQDQISKRRKLNLPEPQIQDQEMEEIVKLGAQGEALHKRYADGVASSLSGDYDDKIVDDSIRTPQIQQSKVKTTIEEIKAMENRSVLGKRTEEEVDDEAEADKDGFAIPKLPSNKAVTSVSAGSDIGGATPAGMTPIKRDALGLVGSVEATPVSILRQKLASLPKPKNDFEITAEDEEEDEEADKEKKPTDNLPVDKGEQARLKRIAEEQERQEALKTRSQTLQRGLPRATVPEVTYNDAIGQEVVALLREEELRFPNKGDSVALMQSEFSLDDLVDAETLIEMELMEGDEQEVQEEGIKTAALPGTVARSDESEEEFKTRVEIISDQLVETLTSLAETCQTEETALVDKFKAYAKRQATLSKKLTSRWSQLESVEVEIAVFSELARMEEIAIEQRSAALQEEVDWLVKKERAAQDKYRELKVKEQAAKGGH
ncbi:Pre-mRNA-splicing factor CEF1 [Yarrowia lipolytica]|jgi:pre-mRNA-splicing factor CDC5/CEF1|uniref:Pre-mRNA-splicing factor CEF1 n=2 Tax=Yarrowia lipolytica TaxID=4952 RepID=CEF1_YARLI|nr:YALI0D20086p [Yarrowia lipolytica CLIB122]Q6C8F5.1 RecName: Full=Pre-mRNA-splicing factor CEF1 [Yarrowia lipolytica CLIB122]RDW26206.1 Pre-mRNA-splicing factor CEF1 [Yarrowia lipolytica]RDW32957.1 Pre-mRNA-splicing factor CEF1 [Yarrowia lipolytica]RDW41842.1 Pre-mRNA-splicing factor CEF1 [Yarrowia lipolytica]RDW43471.1 Pre-mRNA-splicing factor CEF1 [Yarrowia lipolytica]RDW50325.1 Pre-mRNA-splicing factor CEF1 [Yarrowia lipolytica]|eukprot:XP_503057.1 YALI0D20086p [Yarrowia lipolytica CLIB122]